MGSYSCGLPEVTPVSVRRCRSMTLSLFFPRRMECQRGIGGFRDTYLGRQVVSRPGGPRAVMGSAGGLGSAASSRSGSGAQPQPKLNLVPF